MVDLLIYSPIKAQTASFSETRFGGLPVAEKPQEFEWPCCAYCKLPMQFLGKIASGNRLYQIFMCQNDPGVCEEWSPDDGGNKVVVTPLTTLASVSSPAEGETTRAEEYAAHLVTVDANDYEAARKKFTEDNNMSYRQILGQMGGSPFWLQGDDTPTCDLCQKPMHFLAQLEEGPDNKTAMNFGGGSAYVYKCDCGDCAKFLWQC